MAVTANLRRSRRAKSLEKDVWSITPRGNGDPPPRFVVQAAEVQGDDDTVDQTGDDNLIFVVDTKRIKKILRVKVE